MTSASRKKAAASVVTGERRADARMVRAEAASGARRPAAAGRGNDLGAEVVVVGSAGSEVEVEVEVGGGVLAMADGNCSCFAGGKGERGGVAAGTGTQGRHGHPRKARAPKERGTGWESGSDFL